MTVQEHLKQALHNERIFTELGTNKNLAGYDWAITAMFYCVLHFVDAYLLKNYQIVPTGHAAEKKLGVVKDGRNDCVKKYLPKCYQQYKMLYDASRRARYEGAYIEPQSLSNYQNLFRNEFTPLRDFFRGHFKS